MDGHELAAHLDECVIREKVHETEARVDRVLTDQEIEEIRQRFS